MNGRKALSVFGLCVAGLAVLGGLLTAILSYKMTHWIMQTQVTLGPDSQSEKFWADIPAPLLTKVYLFNVSNPKEVSSTGAKPILKEVGPFVFDEYHKKVKIQWNENNDTVTYQQIRTYFLDKVQSTKAMDEPVTIINAPGAVLGALVEPMSPFLRTMVQLGISALKEKLFVTQTPQDIVFDGYTDPILDAAKTLAELGVKIPGQMDKFGIFYNRNGSDWYDGVFNIHTGRDDLSKANKMGSWNYTDQTDFFPGQCSKVEGNAELFTPLTDSSAETIELYSNDLCRPMRLHNKGPQIVKGVQGVRYEMTPEFFANRSDNPSNWCFDGGREWPSGVFNVSACRFGAPVFLSQPHFYQADPWYVSQLSQGSVNPDPERHSTYFVLDTTSGIPLAVTARFQVNLFIEPIKELNMFKNIKGPLFFPAFWFETTMVLDDGMKTQLWLLSNIQSVMICMGMISALLVVAILAVICIRQMAQKGRSPLLPCIDGARCATWVPCFLRRQSPVSNGEGDHQGPEEVSSHSSVSPLIRDGGVQ